VAANAGLTKRDRLQAEKRQLEGEVGRLRERYSEKYPDLVKAQRRLEEVDQQLGELPADAPSSREDSTSEVSATTVRLELIDKDLKRLKAEQAHIQNQIQSYQAKLDAAPLREQQLVELNRNYDASKLHYQALLDKSFNIGMAASLEEKQKGERFTVLDPARAPERPISPRRKLLLSFAVLISMTLPCFVVVLKEMVSARISSETELRSLLPTGVRIVAIIPHIEIAVDRRRGIFLAMAAVGACLLLCVSTAWVLWQMRVLL
jgi:uncharacterized protein involved in exopolysaccharide biosynthesis